MVRHGILTILWPAQFLCSRKGIEFHPTSAQALCDPWSHSRGFLHPKGDTDRWGMVTETLRMLHEKTDERTGSRSSPLLLVGSTTTPSAFPREMEENDLLQMSREPHSWLPKEMRGEGLSFCAGNRQSHPAVSWEHRLCHPFATEQHFCANSSLHRGTAKYEQLNLPQLASVDSQSTTFI